MYNRYIPQADGSYYRRQFPDTPHQRKNAPESEKTVLSDIPDQSKCSPQKNELPKTRCPHCPKGTKPNHSGQDISLHGISSFLSQLLPKDFDASDLMVILLLLLMSGDCQEDQSTALLTLVLYLVM